MTEDSNSVGILFGPGGSDEPLDHHALLLSGDDLRNHIMVSILGMGTISPNKMVKVTEFIARANNKINQYVHKHLCKTRYLIIISGAFKIDSRWNGTVTFETAVDIEGCIAKDLLILFYQYVGVCVGAWKKYFPGIRTILADDNAKPIDVINAL